MTILLAILGVVLACVAVIAKALLTDEVRGRIQRRVAADVEAAIALLPQHLQDEWAEEWRAELAAVISMPIEAVRLARGLRQTATQLVGEPIPAPARTDSLGRTPSRLRSRRDRLAEHVEMMGRRVRTRLSERPARWTTVFAILLGDVVFISLGVAFGLSALTALTAELVIYVGLGAALGYFLAVRE